MPPSSRITVGAPALRPAEGRPKVDTARASRDAPARTEAAAPPLSGLAGLRSSPLARKIVVFNLLALMVLVAGVTWLNPLRDSHLAQRAAAMADHAELIASLLESSGSLAPDGPLVSGLTLPEGMGVAVHAGPDAPAWPDGARDRLPPEADALLAAARTGEVRAGSWRDAQGRTVMAAAVPLHADDGIAGVLLVTGAPGAVDSIARDERLRLAKVLVLALLVSTGLSLVLASTIATPIAELAAAAERGRERNVRAVGPGRVRIPDLAARPDEIGRLSSAMRGMVAALYDRIEMNEQFAADVAHEIKNPLASLRSAVGTLRVAKREDQRAQLLDVIEHDVRRLDRLVSDISNASRLDSELVKEQEARFDLVPMLRNLASHFGDQAESRGIDFITDLPDEPMEINGLEARLAQVFVNLLANAISFCEDGDAVRLWARRRDNRVLVVVEDTGPGIPETAITQIFKRFYSERPAQQFGNHSGLGLAISRQIVEAHGGVIWAENIQPTEADPGSDPLGARFVVGLSV